jgi:hypothetical protein
MVINSGKASAASWHVDVYSGILQGVVIAEIKLKHESQELILPPEPRASPPDDFWKSENLQSVFKK